MKTLIINPGSTSTKIAIFNDKDLVLEHKFDHTIDNKTSFKDRLQLINEFLKENKIEELNAVVGRGGMLPPLTSGTYLVNEKMLDDLINRPQAIHASNLGAPLAKSIADDYKVNAYIVDPVTTDEIEDKHKLTGIPEIKRYAAWHALNQKAVARNYAADIGKKYEDLNLIVAHLGGGFSFGAHKKGQVINVINALSGEGPMTPERAGAIPAQSLIELAFSGQYSKDELINKIAGSGGLFAHLKTKNLIDLEKNYPTMSQPEQNIVDEMIAGISRAICSLIPDFEGNIIDQILLTGGVVRWPLVVEKIKQDLTNVPIGISLYPGEKELEALRDGVLRVLRQEEVAKTY